MQILLTLKTIKCILYFKGVSFCFHFAKWGNKGNNYDTGIVSVFPKQHDGNTSFIMLH